MKFVQNIVSIFCTIAALLGITICAQAAPDYTPTNFVKLPIQVFLPNHEPASHTTVTLRSMSRNMLREFSGYNLKPVITDSDGRAILKYATRIDSPKGEPSGFSVLPVFAIVNSTANHAGAIVLLDNAEPEQLLTIQIVEGYRLLGKIKTEKGDPVTSCVVTINHDLHAQSHTGYGGEIWKRETVTDHNGNFVFEHVNPSPVTITPKWRRNSYWSKTMINGQQKYDRVDKMQPEWNNLENEITIMMSPSPAKVYQGIAVDADGKPIANARVSIGYSWHREETTSGDSHSWETTSTLSDGSWRLEIPTKWVSWGSIRQAGPPGTTTGAAYIKASGNIDLSITAPQVVRLLPADSDQLMPASD